MADNAPAQVHSRFFDIAVTQRCEQDRDTDRGKIKNDKLGGGRQIEIENTITGSNQLTYDSDHEEMKDIAAETDLADETDDPVDKQRVRSQRQRIDQAGKSDPVKEIIGDECVPAEWQRTEQIKEDH